MRPTCLGFRDPKEQTGEYLVPRITHQGWNATYRPTSFNQKTTLSLGGRFTYITDIASRTGYRVGPGSYEINHQSRRKNNGPKIAKELSVQDAKTYDYFYVGNSIVRKQKSPQKLNTSDVLEMSRRSKNRPDYMNNSVLSDTSSRNRIRTETRGNKSPILPRMKLQSAHETLNKNSESENSFLFPKNSVLGTKKHFGPSVNQIDDPFLFPNFKSKDSPDKQSHRSLRQSNEATLQERSSLHIKEVVNRYHENDIFK